jgi:hypothetical protein
MSKPVVDKHTRIIYEVCPLQATPYSPPLLVYSPPLFVYWYITIGIVYVRRVFTVVDERVNLLTIELIEGLYLYTGF